MRDCIGDYYSAYKWGLDYGSYQIAFLHTPEQRKDALILKIALWPAPARLPLPFPNVLAGFRFSGVRSGFLSHF